MSCHAEGVKFGEIEEPWLSVSKGCGGRFRQLASPQVGDRKKDVKYPAVSNVEAEVVEGMN